MSTLGRTRIRIAGDAASFNAPLDINRSATPQFWRGNDIQFEIGLFFNGVLQSVSNVASMSIEVRAMGAGGQAPDPSATPLMAKTISSLDDTLTQNTWDDDSKQHGLVSFASTETNVTAGMAWLSIFVITNDSPGRVITLAAGPLRVGEDGAGLASEPPDATQTYYTAAESDARYLGGGGTAAWGSITGTLSSQTDLASALSAKAPLASPTLTGTPLAPTATAGTATTQIATTAFVAASFAPLASPALTGTPTAPTVGSAGDSSTKIATTAFVHAAISAAGGGGGSSPWTTSGSDIYYATGNVEIRGSANKWVLGGSSTGNNLTMTAVGSDTNVIMQAIPKGVNGFFAIGPTTAVAPLINYHSGSAGVGPSGLTPPAPGPIDFYMQNRDSGNGWCGISVMSTLSDGTWPYLELCKMRGSAASPSAVQDKDIVGEVAFCSHNGSNLRVTALLDVWAVGSPAKAGKFCFVVADSSGGFDQTNPVMTITSSGVTINGSLSYTGSGFTGQQTTSGGGSTGVNSWKGLNDASRYSDVGIGGSSHSAELIANQTYLYGSAGGVNIIAGDTSQIRFAVGGASNSNVVVKIGANGFVGPSVNVNQSSTSNTQEWRATNDGSRFASVGCGGSAHSAALIANNGYLYTSAGGLSLIADGSNDIRFAVGGSGSGNVVMTVKSGGYLEIPASSSVPAPFSITANIAATAYGKIANSNASGSSAWRAYNDGSRFVEFGFGGSSNANDLIVNQGYFYSSNGGISFIADGSNSLRFAVGGVASGNEAFRVDSAKNLVFSNVVTSAPNATLSNSQYQITVYDNAGTAVFEIRYKDGSGTVKTGTVALS